MMWEERWNSLLDNPKDFLSDQFQNTLGNYDEKFYGVTVGEVIDLADPFNLGRVQIKLPSIDSLDLQPWARVAVLMAGPTHGTYFIPNVGDQVLVTFEHGDVNVPYIIGSLWNTVSIPPLPSPIPQIKTIRTSIGNQIVFNDVEPSVSIQSGPTPPGVLPSPPSPVGPHQSIRMSPAGLEVVATTVTIKSGDNSIVITPAGITITNAKSISLNSSGAINLNGSSVNIKSGTINMEAGMVKIN